MCRFLAYQGEPILLETLVATPCRSLIHQSLHATEAKTETNGDGFGLGWYGDRAVLRCRLAVTESALQHLTAEVRQLIARGIPEPAIV